MDFHRATNATLTYLREKYGQEFVDDVVRRTARDVYRAIREDLKSGNCEHLLEHWQYFFGREGGKCHVERNEDEIRFVVEKCPAIAYLKEKGLEIDPEFCRITVVLNEALAEGTAFDVATEVQGNGKCVQTIRRARP